MTYGIIKTKSGRTYVSPIFALKYVGWKSEAVAFDETFSKIIRIKLHDTGFGGIGRTVFVIENDFDTSKGDWAGFDWVINDKALFKALRSKKGADVESFPLFKNYCKEIQLPERFEIKNDKDIAAKFKKDPITTVEGLIGIDLPNDQIEKIVEGIKAKIALDKIDVDKVAGVLGGLFGKK